MTIVTDAPGVEAITDIDTVDDDAAADRDQDGTGRTELVRLLAQAYVAAPLFA